MTVAKYIANMLYKEGVTDAFGIPGGVILDLIYAFDKVGITPHLSYHEQSAAFEACGYAQTSHTLGVAYATRGPGFTNLITGIAEAYSDSLPVVFITAHTGKVVGHDQRFEKEQELDSVDMVKHITKYAAAIDSIDYVESTVKKALTEAMSGRKGPVFIDVSTSLWNQEIISKYGFVENNPHKPSYLDTNEVKKAIRTSVRPLVLLGDGVRQAGMAKEISELVNTWNVPVVSSRGSQDCGALCNLYYGYIGSHGIRYANSIFIKADLVISIGNRLAFPLNSESYVKAISNKTLIRIENDASELKRIVPKTINIGYDLQDVLPILKEISFNHNSTVHWNAECKEIKDILVEYDINSTVEFLSAIIKHSEDSYIVADVGNNEFWVSRAYELAQSSSRVLYSKSYGTLGCAIGKAIGCYYKSKKKVICIVGDQGFQLNMQELQLITQEKLPIIIIVINNETSGMIKDREHKQEYYLHTTRDSGFGCPNIEYIARAYGIEFIKTNEAISLLGEEPLVVEYMADESIGLEPSLPNGADMDDMLPALSPILLKKIREI